MSGVFQVQGFGVLSEWNGQVSGAAANQAMQQIAAAGANSIEIAPRIWTTSKTSSTVFTDPARTESDASLIQGILNAEKDGLSVVLKPAISGLDGTISSALAPSDVATFFASYKTEIVHLAQIAQETGVATLALGNEMSGLTGAQYLPYWTDIIAAVRAVYHGDLTYAAATDEASKVSFWSQLDTIGVNTYPPLSVPGTPTVQDLVNAWSQVPTNPYWAAAFEHMSPVDFLHALSVQYGKPVLMTEAGYMSVQYSGTITGNWKTTGALDVQEQANAYKAFLEVWGPQAGSNWLKGVEFWQWDMNNAYSPTGFSPMGKPAQAIVSEFFKGAGSLATKDVASLTTSDIASLAALGIKTIPVTDHDVNLSAAQQAALGALGISLTEPFGTGSQTWTWNADGTLHDIKYYAIDGQTASTLDIAYGPDGQPVIGSGTSAPIQVSAYNSDGSVYETVVSGITGQKWTWTDTVFGASGKAVSETWHNGGTLVQSQTWNADGSVHDIHFYGITGQAYTDYDIVYGSNGKKADAVYSDGLAQTWTYNADGSLHETVVTGITGQSSDATDTIYGANGKALSETWHDGATLVQAETWNSDGSVHDIHFYGITGQAYTDYDLIYGANGKKAAAIYSDGLSQTWTYNADGSLHESVVTGITGQTSDSTDTVYGSNGKAVSEAWHNGATLVETETWNPDGSIHDIHFYGITGQAYADYDLVYGSNAKKAAAVYSDGQAQSQTPNVDGSPHLSGTETIHGLADHLTFMSSAAGTSVATADGTSFGFAPSAGTTLTGGGSNETFVFGAGFGHATVTDFVPQALATTNHDTIVLAPGTFANFADVLSHATQSGHDTVITDHSGDTLVLQHVLVAQLTAHDFSIL
jgi:hypothetical protein